MIGTKRMLYYPMVLLLSNNFKSAEALAEMLSISGDTLLRILKNECVSCEELLKVAKEKFGMEKVTVVIDDTLIKKVYSRYIEGSSDNYDPVTKTTVRSLCTVVAMITDGKIAIPVVHKLWTNKEFCPEDYYQTKTEIAQELIEKLIGQIPIKIILMDGLYATVDMIKWLNRKNLLFEMRFHSNRRIVFNTLSMTVKECKELKLKGKKNCRTIQASWKGITVYITSVKRYEKDGSSRIVYQISNASLLARNHAKQYDKRWPIEQFFRTSKQYLGMNSCQSRKKISQENHIYNVFFAYTILQFERRKKKFKCPEEALKAIKRKNNIPISVHLKRAEQIFRSNESAYA
jgi:Transposase DDE domain